jgi:HemY protein
MRAALWFLALFGIAVAAALFAGNNQGTVTVYWPPYRVDVSLNLVLLVLVGSMVVLYFATRAMAGLVDLPRRARIWRNQQKERAMHEALLGGTAYMLAGRFARAQKNALVALSQAAALSDRAVKTQDMPPHTAQNAAQTTALAHLLVAGSAHALQDQTRRDQHLQDLLLAVRAEGVSPAIEEGAKLRAARWALDDHAPQRALDLIAALPHGVARRTATLRIKLKAARLGGQPQLALETARLLAKHGAFSADAAQATVRAAALDCIRMAHDAGQVHSAWANLSPSERQMPELVIATAQNMVQFEPFGTSGLTLLLPIWEQYALNPSGFAQNAGASLPGKLVRALETGLRALSDQVANQAGNQVTAKDAVQVAHSETEATSSAWLARLESAQSRHPRVPELQYLVGVVCQQRRLWGKAQQMMALATQGLSDPALLRDAWCVSAALAERQGDTAAALHAWKQAAMQA